MATAAQQARWRAKVAEAGRCSNCGRPRLAKLKRCAWCLAYDLEKRLPDFEHDRRAHAAMLELSHDDDAWCAVTGLSGAQLAEVGDALTVDRIDSDRGYVVGNMQLLSRRLNRAKWRDLTVPVWAVERALRLWRGEHLGDWDVLPASR